MQLRHEDVTGGKQDAAERHDDAGAEAVGKGAHHHGQKALYEGTEGEAARRHRAAPPELLQYGLEEDAE
jgi:hypothetical protein